MFKKTDHPTEKYEWMIKPLIKVYSNKGDLIGDFFCGSGTTCVISKKLGRKYIGIEKNKEFYKMSKKRLFNTKKHNLNTSY